MIINIIGTCTGECGFDTLILFCMFIAHRAPQTLLFTFMLIVAEVLYYLIPTLRTLLTVTCKPPRLHPINITLSRGRSTPFGVLYAL